MIFCLHIISFYRNETSDAIELSSRFSPSDLRSDADSRPINHIESTFLYTYALFFVVFLSLATYALCVSLEVRAFSFAALAFYAASGVLCDGVENVIVT